MRYLMSFIILLLLLSACSNEQTETKVQNSSNESIEIQHDLSTKDDLQLIAPIKQDVKFSDFKLNAQFDPFRMLKHTDEKITYTLYEYKINTTIQDLDSWIRSESNRLGGQLIERYTYSIEEGRLDFIILLPSQSGTTILSSYLQQYLGKSYFIILETEFTDIVDIDENYEDHALVISIPQPNNNTIEVFKGMYPHQHTDIYSYYFYSEAFLAEIENYTTFLDGRKLASDDYLVGYFDKEGNEVSPYDIATDKFDDYIFGIQLRSDFLPEDINEQEQFLFHWAQTLLLGNRAQSYNFEGDNKVNFLQSGSIYKSFSIEELAK